MAEAYATVDEYKTETQATLSDAAAAQVTAKLVNASALIRSILPSDYEPDPDIARMVAIQAVQRAITNPGGRRYRQVGSTSEGYDVDGGLYVTDREQEQLLRGYDPTNGQGGTAYTVGLQDHPYRARQYGRAAGRYGYRTDDCW